MAGVERKERGEKRQKKKEKKEKKEKRRETIVAASPRKGYRPARDADGLIVDPLASYPAYVKAMAFYRKVADDTDRLMTDPRGRVIASQVIKAAGSVCANFEEGYGRGTTNEFVHRLRIAAGEARETRGWYYRSEKFLPRELIETRVREASEVIALLVSMIKSLDRRR